MARLLEPRSRGPKGGDIYKTIICGPEIYRCAIYFNTAVCF